MFTSSGQYLYVGEEMGNAVAVFKVDRANNRIDSIQRISSLPEDFSESNTTADIHLSPDEKYLYISNRGHNSLAIYEVDPATGMLSLKGHHPTGGKTPRNFYIDRTGTFVLVANQNSNQIRVLRRDVSTGLLETTQEVMDAPSPVCLELVQF